MYDVLVVGGGPVGSFAAARLSALGHSVAVIEEHEQPGEGVCCTGIIGSECFDAFPMDRSMVLREARSARFFSPCGRELRVAKDTTQAMIVDRPAFDRYWAGRAGAAGSEFLWGVRVTDVSLAEGAVRAAVTGARGETTIEGRVLVLASGFGGVLSQKLGLGKVGDFVMGAQVEVEAPGLEEVEVYFGSVVAPGFFAWLVPTTEGRALAGLLVRHDAGAYLARFASALADAGRVAAVPDQAGFGAIPLMPLSRTYRSRVVVVGDAAGQVKPTSGGGIYYGFLCAEKAVEAIQRSFCSNDFSEQAFAWYEREWQKRLSRELRIGRWARRSFEQLSDRQIDRVFQIVEARGLHRSLPEAEGFSFDWHGGLVLNVLKHLGIEGAMQMGHALLSRKLLGLSMKD